MTSWRPSWICFEIEKSIKSLRTSICTYIPNFIKIRPFLTKLEFWRETRFTYDVIAAILKIVGLQILKREALQPKLNLLVKTPCLYHLWFWRSSRHKKIKMAAVAAILVDLVKK